MSWQEQKKNIDILAKETGTQVFAPGSRRGFAFIYPNTYNIGMSNLGLHILYREINARGDTACERFFLPDKSKSSNVKRLLSMETQRELTNFPIIGVMMSFELDYFNFLHMLDLAKIPLLAKERDDNWPLIIVGGPCATFNPEPLALFADLFVIGEGEETINKILDKIYENEHLSKQERLVLLANVPGVYVPQFYQPVFDEEDRLLSVSVVEKVPEKVQKQWVRDLDSYAGHYQILTPLTEFSNMFAVEVARGCGRNCRFCMAGYCFRQPRAKNLEVIWQEIINRPEQSEKVGLVGAAVCDYPYIKELTQRLIENNIAFSVSSLRADTLDFTLAKALAENGQKTLTIAPEAGSERLRKVINKGIDEEDILRAIDIAAQVGISNIKLYFMIGLPTETNDDIIELVNLVEKIKSSMKNQKGKLSLSINPFIPKPFTPFQWSEMTDIKVLEDRVKFLQKAFKQDKNILISVESFKSSVIQLALARGSRKIGELLLLGHKDGGVKQFGRLLKEYAKSNFNYKVERSYEYTEVLPWDLLDMGFSKDYLLKEWTKNQQESTTSQCFKGCKRCGICEE